MKQKTRLVCARVCAALTNRRGHRGQVKIHQKRMQFENENSVNRALNLNARLKVDCKRAMQVGVPTDKWVTGMHSWAKLPVLIEQPVIVLLNMIMKIVLRQQKFKR